MIPPSFLSRIFLFFFFFFCWNRDLERSDPPESISERCEGVWEQIRNGTKRNPYPCPWVKPTLELLKKKSLPLTPAEELWLKQLLLNIPKISFLAAFCSEVLGSKFKKLQGYLRRFLKVWWAQPPSATSGSFNETQAAATLISPWGHSSVKSFFVRVLLLAGFRTGALKSVFTVNKLFLHWEEAAFWSVPWFWGKYSGWMWRENIFLSVHTQFILSPWKLALQNVHFILIFSLLSFSPPLCANTSLCQRLQMFVVMGASISPSTGSQAFGKLSLSPFLGF